MAQVFVSPGVYTQELDETFLPAAAGGGVGASIVGLTNKGPAFAPTRINNFGEFREVFGGLDPDIYAPYAARGYLRHSSSLNVVRVLGRGSANIGEAVILAFPTSGTTPLAADAALSATNTVLAVLRFRGDAFDVQLSGTPSNFTLGAYDEGVTATNLSLDQSSNSYIGKVLGVDPVNARASDTLTGLYVDSIFDYNFADITGTVQGEAANADMSSATAEYGTIAGGFNNGTTPWITSQNYNGNVHKLFRLHTLSHGTAANKDVKVSVTQVDTSSTSYPQFSVVVRDINDSDEQPVVYETFSNVNLDSRSKQYIARVIGDRSVSHDLTQNPPEVLYDGEYANRSKYVRVELSDDAPVGARPSGFEGLTYIDAGPSFTTPNILNHLNSRGVLDPNIFTGYDFSAKGSIPRLNPGNTEPTGTKGSDDGILIISNTEDYTGSSSVANVTLIDQVGGSSGNFTVSNPIRFSVPFVGGFDGFDPRQDRRVTINDGSISADIEIAINTLANPDEVDFNLLATPGMHSSSVGNIPAKAIDMVQNRGDAFYILDISKGTATGDGLSMTVDEANAEADKYDSNYAATYYPWIRINDVDNDKLVWVPPSVEVLSAYAFNDRVAQPWWAPAGFNRGGLENVLEARRRLTQGQRDDLQAKNINPIATFPGQGIVIWGQQTLQKKASLLDRVNVRRMLLEVRKTIAGFSRLFVFDPNTVTNRSRLQSLINNYLGDVQSANGLVEFRAVLDESTTTPDLIDRNIMKGKIILKPTTAAEVVLLDFAVTRNGAVFTD